MATPFNTIQPKRFRVVVHFYDLILGQDSWTPPKYNSTLEGAIKRAKDLRKQYEVPHVSAYVDTQIQELNFVRVVPAEELGEGL